MNARIEVRGSSAESLRQLREDYLDALPFAQDAYLEALVGEAEFFLIEYKQDVIGYCALSAQQTLVEHYLTPPATYLAQSVFPQLVSRLPIRRALIKSFDDLALSVALDLGRRTTVKGMLVRDYVPQALPQLPHISYVARMAEPRDLERVLGIEQNVFTHRARLASVIERRFMLLFEREDQLVGFGIVKPVIGGRKDAEVGIVIDRAYRNKGYAAYILRDLVEHCIARGENPVSGCSIENLASIRLGQRIGLCARHRLLEIEF